MDLTNFLESSQDSKKSSASPKLLSVVYNINCYFLFFHKNLSKNIMFTLSK